MSDLTCTTIDDQFQRESSRYGVDIHLQLRERNPWYALIPKTAFPLGMGYSLREMRVDRVYNGSAETDWSDVSTSDSDQGGTNPGCTPAPTALEWGQSYTAWNLKTKSYMTPCLCLDDLKTSFQIQSQVEKTVEALTQVTDAVFANRARYEYARLVPKLSATPGWGNANGLAGDTTDSMTGAIQPPTSILHQSWLDAIYSFQMREGSGLNPITREDGAPVLGLITSRESSNSVITASGYRDDIRWGDPGELLKPLGVKRVFKGYVHIVDPELPRFNFANNAWTRVLPYTSEAASTGTRAVPNYLYDTAEYELNYIFSTDVYDCAIQQVGPTIPGASFEDHPYYYTGQFFWLNIKNEQYNPLGKIGRWLAIFQNGSRPKLVNRGRVLMVKRCPTDFTVSGCTYGA